MDHDSLASTAAAMVAPGKGLLAADESAGTIAKRLKSIDVADTEENRRDYRELLFCTSDAMENNISGVILFDETIRQSAADGTPLVRLIEGAGAIPGIKVDKGAHAFDAAGREKLTEGLDGLWARLKEYRQLGARFAKWRAVIDIDTAASPAIPTAAAVQANMMMLARYAVLCQQEGLVPIVEPEVLMDGAHAIDTCFEVTANVLQTLYGLLHDHGVFLEGSILKPNMVIAGRKSPDQASSEAIAEKTVRCFRRHVPAAVPGIVFLSGGQSEVQATENLNTINSLYAGTLPWAVSFSYGRALQASALEAWRGKAENVPAAQAAFAHRARMNGLAGLGKWSPEAESRS